MLIIYRLSIWLYGFVIGLLASVNPRAKIFYRERKRIFERLEADFSELHGKLYWFHAASLGEYEQAKPLIALVKSHEPNTKVLVTFFSPSGYENCKDRSIIDYVHYLPLDTRGNVHRFLEIVNPSIAIFVKYEFWYFFLVSLKQKSIPTLLISGIFRKNQMYFHPLGRFYWKAFHSISHYFLQDEFSGTLLNEIGVRNWSITGDTRFDRVMKISMDPMDFPLIRSFKGEEKIIMMGSTWPSDIKEIRPFIDANLFDYKFVIAPHNIDKQTIKSLQELPESVLYSQFDQSARVLIIDQIGILSRIYRFADYAVVGGGFRGALHNVLEPAVYGVPVFFGAHDMNDKFIEATELVLVGGGFTFEDEQDFDRQISILEKDEIRYKVACEAAQAFVVSRCGAAQKIFEKMKELV